tara:strand:- start:122312 stop:124999 length:2688 start_codon:yes stop_codon:yes gene_type:complete
MINMVFQSAVFGQADILSNLTPEQLAQFNQLPPQQRQELLNQLQLGSTSGFELPVTQPQTVSPRETNESNAEDSASNAEEGIEGRENLSVNEGRPESYNQRILRKALRLSNLGIDVAALDTYGELAQMGVLETLRNGEFSFEGAGEESRNDFAEDRVRTGSRNTNTQLRPFGYDLFAGIPSTFAPATDIPVSSNYIVGPGDTVVLQLYGQLNVRYELAVSREGLIQFPEVGPLNVSGLSFEEMSNLIRTTVDNTLIGQNVSITMGQLRSIQIFVLGEAYQPGIYTVSSLATMTNALFSSGGVSELASLRDIRLIRGGELLTTLDLYDLLLTGDTRDDARLQPNDVIFIPTKGRTVGITGEVLRPAIFELNAEETVEDVLTLAGELLPTAYPLLAHIERINQLGQRTIIDLDLANENDLSTTVMDGDIIQIDSILNQIELGVSLEGHVYRPGTYAWSEGVRVSDILRRDNFRAAPDMDYALLVREIEPERNIEVLQLDLRAVFNNPDTIDDPLLQARDRILVFGEDSLENRLDRRLLIHPVVQTLKYQSATNNFRKVATVRGAVNAPGEYPLIDNMSLEDLLAAAGGAAEHADLNESELTRQVFTRERGMVAETMPLNLTDALNLNASVEPLDQLSIRQLPNWGQTATVTIEGEVLSPGTYVIGPNDSLLSLIQRAGGLTEFADPKAAIFLREELRENEQELLDAFNDRLTFALLNQSLSQSSGQLQQNTVNLEVMNQLLEQIREAEPQGRLVIDLPNLISSQNRQSNVILRDGDQLLIPRSRQSISVMGEVQVATSHMYNPELGVREYINRSGGYTDNASPENVFVIKSSGEVILYAQTTSWFSFSNQGLQLEAGDNIVVPYNADIGSSLVTWMNVSTVLFNLTTTLLAVDRLRD